MTWSLVKWTQRVSAIPISGWWYTYPPEKYESQIGSSSQLLGKVKHVPNHQPDFLVHLFSERLAWFRGVAFPQLSYHVLETLSSFWFDLNPE